MSVNVMTLKPGDVVMVRVAAHGWQDSGGSKRTTVRPARVIEVYRRFCTVLLYRGKQVIRESPHYDAIEAINPDDVHPGSVPPMPGTEQPRFEPEPEVAIAPEPEPEQSQDSEAPDDEPELLRRNEVELPKSNPVMAIPVSRAPGAPRRTTKGVPVTDEDIARVATLMEDGLGAVRIARELGITSSRAQHIMRKIQHLKKVGKMPNVGAVAEEPAPTSPDAVPEQGAPDPTLSPEDYARQVAEHLRPMIREVIVVEIQSAIGPMLDRVEDMTDTITATADIQRLRRELSTVGGMINRALQRIEKIEVWQVG